MKRISIFVIVALLIGLFVGGAINFGNQSSFAQNEMTKDKVVEIVKDKYKGPKNIKVEKEKENGEMFFEAEFLLDGNKQEVLLNDKGKILNQANEDDDKDMDDEDNEDNEDDDKDMDDEDNEDDEDDEHEYENENGEDDD